MPDLSTVTFLPERSPDRLSTAQVLEVWDRVCGTMVTPAVAARLWKFYCELKRVEDAHLKGHTPISELGVSPTTVRLLQSHGVHTIEALKEMNMGDILNVPGIGNAKFDSIREALGRRSRLRAA